MRSRCFVCPTPSLVQSLGVSTTHAWRTMKKKKGKRREQRSLENLESQANLESQTSPGNLETPVESPANLASRENLENLANLESLASHLCVSMSPSRMSRK